MVYLMGQLVGHIVVRPPVHLVGVMEKFRGGVVRLPLHPLVSLMEEFRGGMMDLGLVVEDFRRRVMAAGLLHLLQHLRRCLVDLRLLQLVEHLG